MAICACGAEATANGRECPTCWRARIKTVQVAYAPTRSLGRGFSDLGANRKGNRQLDRYAAARAEGIQPKTTNVKSVDKALRLSDESGQAFRADRASIEWEKTHAG